MSADLIFYCLERITDYRDFERFCSAFLAGCGYPGIDPLGGTGDEGRDAIVREDSAGRRIGFAYTVRSDWRTKLAGDCKRVHEKGHDPDIFVFVVTESLSASEKDFAYGFVTQQYGWTLDLFDMERLRAQLVARLSHLIAQHPSIFTPPFFPQRGGQSIAPSADTLIIDHVAADHALATWLSRRLTLVGYRTWCQGTSPLAGENEDETVRKLLEVRGRYYLPVMSAGSVSAEMFLERCVIASTRENFVLPCTASEYPVATAPSRLAKLIHADFRSAWSRGLKDVLAKLAASGIQPSLGADRGRQIALGDYLPSRVTTGKPEPVFANIFALKLPKAMLLFDLQRPLSETETLELRRRWAFVEMNPSCLVAFTPPPNGALPVVEGQFIAEFGWADFKVRGGKKTEDLAKDLTRRSFDVVCAQKGLKYCENRGLFYFPEHESGAWTQAIKHVDGRATTVNLNGARTKGYGEHASPFLYQLVPLFRPQTEEDGTWTVAVRIYIRTTALDGTIYEGKEIGRRRKVVSKSWWNKEWLARLLGVVQALETAPGRIQVGEGVRALVLETKPLSWECPVGLDVLALSGVSDIGEEMAANRLREDDDNAAGDAEV
jgi:hypothetical protein